MPIPNSDYWIDRADHNERRSNKDAEIYLIRLNKQFNKAIRDIEKEISLFYSDYAEDNFISYEDAQKALSPKERKQYQDQLDYYIQLVNQNAGKRYNTEVRNMSNKVRITRYQALLTNIRAVIDELYGNEFTGYQPNAESLLADVYSQSYYQSLYDIQKGIGFGTSFASLNMGAINQAINYPWSGASFSDRIWENKSRLLLNMRNIITQGMIQGTGVAQEALELSKRMRVGFSDAERLIRTETNHVLNSATMKSYEEQDVEQYEYLATLDSRTSTICRDLDGKKFLAKDAVPGKNMPSMHVRCRSTTVPYIDDDFVEELERVARDPNTNKVYRVPASMNYPEWEKKYVKQDTP